MEEEIIICLGGQLYKVSENIAEDIFTTIIKTPPIDYKENQKEINDMLLKIKEAKENNIY